MEKIIVRFDSLDIHKFYYIRKILHLLFFLFNYIRINTVYMYTFLLQNII